MKTFEERYTAWIDGELNGSALVDFEQELARRATAGEARADKSDATRLHDLLTAHLRAPEMTNADFFGHQLLQRIEADRMSARRKEEARTVRVPLFAWPFAKLAGLGAAFLFVTVALYYGLMPEPSGSPDHVALNKTPTYQVVPDPGVPTNNSQPVPPPPGPGNSENNGQYAQLITPTTDIRDIHVAEPAANTTTATPLHYKDPNVNVLWINGLDYLPTVPGDNAAASPATPAPAPTAGVNP